MIASMVPLESMPEPMPEKLTRPLASTDMWLRLIELAMTVGEVAGLGVRGQQAFGLFAGLRPEAELLFSRILAHESAVIPIQDSCHDAARHLVRVELGAGQHLHGHDRRG